MYAKLIIKNAKRSLKDYLIYIVTLTLCVAMFYSFLSITSKYYNPNIGVQYDLSLLGSLMEKAIFSISLLILFLIKYVNNYMLRRRKKEFGLQTLMGMEKKTTALIFFLETMLMGVIALVAGIVLGVFLSQLITAMLLSSYGTSYQIIWSLFPDTVFWTIGYFLICFIVIGLLNVRVIRKIKIIDMLKADKQNELSIKSSKWQPVITCLYILMLIVMLEGGITKKILYFDSRLPLSVRIMFWGNIIAPALSLLASAIWIVNCKKWKFKRLVNFLLITMIFVAGFLASVPILDLEYYLFDAGTINKYMAFLIVCIIYFICSIIYFSGYYIENIKEKSLNIKYHGENLFFFGQILSKLKVTSKTMTLICLTFTLSIGLFLSAPALAGWASGFLEARAVYDVQVFSSYNNVYETSNLPKDDFKIITDFLNNNEVEISKDCLFDLYLPREEEFHNRIKLDFPVLAMSLSDYNYLRNMIGLEAITLKENEFTTQWQSVSTEEEIEEFLSANSEVHTDAGRLYLSKNSFYKERLGETLYNSYTDLIYIFPDDVCTKLIGVNRNRYIKTSEPIPYNTAIELGDLFTESFQKQEGGPSYFVRTSSQQINETTASIFVLRTGMIYSAVVLMISCFTILALQQISEADQFGYRFSVIRKMGVEESRINRLILKQIGVWFGLPICVSVFSAVIFISYFFTTISANINAYMGEGELFSQIAAIVAILVVLLVCYFITTYTLFKKQK